VNDTIIPKIFTLPSQLTTNQASQHSQQQLTQQRKNHLLSSRFLKNRTTENKTVNSAQHQKGERFRNHFEEDAPKVRQPDQIACDEHIKQRNWWR